MTSRVEFSVHSVAATPSRYFHAIEFSPRLCSRPLRTCTLLALSADRRVSRYPSGFTHLWGIRTTGKKKGFWRQVGDQSSGILQYTRVPICISWRAEPGLRPTISTPCWFESDRERTFITQKGFVIWLCASHGRCRLWADIVFSLTHPYLVYRIVHLQLDAPGLVDNIVNYREGTRQRKNRNTEHGSTTAQCTQKEKKG